jgi:polar amino acid transport system substrate-binding protein
MTRQWIVALSLGAALSACAPQTVQRAEPGTIRFAVDSTPFPPFATRDSAGKWAGFEVDLMDAVCAEMKAKCVVAPTPWDALIAKLQAGDIDVIWASMTVTEERRRVIDFTDIYYNTPMIILAAKSSIIDPARPETLKGKRIAALTRARADAILIDRSLTDRFLKSPRGAVYAVKWTAPWNLAATAGVAAGLRKSDADLKARLNTALKAVRQSGRFKQIQDRYFDYEISGM